MASEYGGVRYASRLEAAYAQELDLRARAKDIRGWRRQVRIPLDVNGMHVCTYVMDFEITHNDGTIEMVETKGAETDVWRLKWKLTKALFSKERPDVRLTVVKKGRRTFPSG